MQTRNQKFAVAVFSQIENLERVVSDEKERKKYGAMAHKLPVLIRTAGLAQALGFLAAKSDDDKGKMNRQLFCDLASTLGKANTDELLRHSRGGDNQSLADYLRLTQDALAALLWYKRFAESVLDVKAGDVQGE